jgi:LacI family sucrose operon transcriptional repressor
LFTAACGLLEGVLRYLNQHNLMDCDMRLCSFDDHYLFDCLPMKIDTVAQDCETLARNSFEMITALIEGQPLAESRVYVPTRLHWRHPDSHT